MLLAIDTTTATASLAVYDPGAQELLAEVTWQARRRQTQDLLVAAQQLMQLIQVTPDALTALAVTTGPGSFTGVRIGISVVKGMALGLARPPQVVGVPVLAVTAAPWLDAASGSPPAQICACIQAGRGRFNWAWFAAGDWSSRPGVADHGAGIAAELVDDLTRRADRPVWLCGELTPELIAASRAAGNVTVIDNVSGLRRAGQLARLAALHLAAGTTDELETLQPLYLRNPS